MKVDQVWFAMICGCKSSANQCTEQLRTGRLANQMICNNFHPICAYNSDRVKIHADLHACIFDVVYFDLIWGVHFGHLWCLRLPRGCCGGDGRAAGVATGCHVDN